MKNIVLGLWILTMGSVLWLLSKASPSSIVMDWFLFIFILFVGAYSGDILIRMSKINWSRPYWKELAGLGILFILGVVIILFGIVLSAINALGNPWFGFVIAIIGLIYFYNVLGRIEIKYRQLSA